ncbi:MAG: transposase InsO family protein [Crocinitomix sp.]|jgi:transposase InsO family protein
MPKTRKKYHSSIKLAHALQLENELLPKEFLNEIASSTANDWKLKFKPENLVGHEFAKTIDSNLEDAQKIVALSSQSHRDIFISILLARKFLIQALSKKGFQRLLRVNKVKTIRFVDWVSRKTKSSKTRIVEYLGIGSQTFRNWKNQVLFPCNHSDLNLCLTRHPNQATYNEVSEIKRLLTNPSKLHWAIASIQGYAFKNKLCLLSVSSWYRYNRLLGIRKAIAKWNRSPYKPLRANLVNEIWHADITVYKTLDGIKQYIYTVLDNFSRKTLVWLIADRVSAKIRLDTIKQALNLAFPNESGSVRLITDGGPENDNLTMKEFMINNQGLINHQIALRDIEQSNSMVEASYQTLKKYNLYGKQIFDGIQLNKELESHFIEHDDIKPHYAHKIYTPNEVYHGADPKTSLTPQYRKAAIERRIVNQNASCGVC